MASNPPKISVIMPAYNTARLIAASLDSVLKQSFQDFEILVVNDGSPDTPALEAALASYLEKIVYIKQENKRAAGARNTAIRQARGEFLAFLDSDDTWLPDHLESQMKLFAEDQILDLVYCNCFAFADLNATDEFMDRCPSRGRATFDALIVERCQIPISTVVARKSAIVQAGLFDEGLLRCDDYDMWIRIAFDGGKIAYTRKVHARLNEGRPGSLGVSAAKMAEAYSIILEKAKLLPLTDVDRQIVEARSRQIRARSHTEEGKVFLREGNFEKAKEHFGRANEILSSRRVSLVLIGLKIAPRATSKLASLLERN